MNLFFIRLGCDFFLRHCKTVVPPCFADYLKRPTKPFAPLSMDDILVGMRVLVTRSSGRIGKGVVKWKGYLDGHAEPFIGIELETPSNYTSNYVFLPYAYTNKLYTILSSMFTTVKYELLCAHFAKTASQSNSLLLILEILCNLLISIIFL